MKFLTQPNRSEIFDSVWSEALTQPGTSGTAIRRNTIGSSQPKQTTLPPSRNFWNWPQRVKTLPTR
jgi:hypothetical protein